MAKKSDKDLTPRQILARMQNRAGGRFASGYKGGAKPISSRAKPTPAAPVPPVPPAPTAVPTAAPTLTPTSGSAPAVKPTTTLGAVGPVSPIGIQIGLLKALEQERKRLGVKTTPMDRYITGGEGITGVRQIIQDYIDKNADKFDVDDPAGAAAFELMESAVTLSEQSLGASREEAKRIYVKLRFLRNLAKKTQGSQSEIAKKLDTIIAPVEKQLKGRTSFLSFLKERSADFARSIPERIVRKVPLIGGLIGDYMRQRRDLKEDVKAYSGQLEEEIARGGRRGMGLRLPGFGRRGAAMGSMGRGLVTGGLPENTIREMMTSGVEESPTLTKVYDEVVKIRELMEEYFESSMDELKAREAELENLRKMTKGKGFGADAGAGAGGEKSGDGATQGGWAVDLVKQAIAAAIGTGLSAAIYGKAKGYLKGAGESRRKRAEAAKAKADAEAKIPALEDEYSKAKAATKTATDELDKAKKAGAPQADIDAAEAKVKAAKAEEVAVEERLNATKVQAEKVPQSFKDIGKPPPTETPAAPPAPAAKPAAAAPAAAPSAPAAKPAATADALTPGAASKGTGVSGTVVTETGEKAAKIAGKAKWLKVLKYVGHIGTVVQAYFTAEALDQIQKIAQDPNLDGVTKKKMIGRITAEELGPLLGSSLGSITGGVVGAAAGAPFAGVGGIIGGVIGGVGGGIGGMFAGEAVADAMLEELGEDGAYDVFFEFSEKNGLGIIPDIDNIQRFYYPPPSRAIRDIIPTPPQNGSTFKIPSMDEMGPPRPDEYAPSAGTGIMKTIPPAPTPTITPTGLPETKAITPPPATQTQSDYDFGEIVQTPTTPPAPAVSAPTPPTPPASAATGTVSTENRKEWAYPYYPGRQSGKIKLEVEKSLKTAGFSKTEKWTSDPGQAFFETKEIMDDAHSEASKLHGFNGEEFYYSDVVALSLKKLEEKGYIKKTGTTGTVSAPPTPSAPPAPTATAPTPSAPPAPTATAPTPSAPPAPTATGTVVPSSPSGAGAVGSLEGEEPVAGSAEDRIWREVSRRYWQEHSRRMVDIEKKADEVMATNYPSEKPGSPDYKIMRDRIVNRLQQKMQLQELEPMKAQWRKEAEMLEQQGKLKGSGTIANTNTTLGKMVSEYDAERSSLESARADAQATNKSDVKSNNSMVASNISNTTNNFSDEMKVRNNEPTLRFMQTQSISIV